MKISCDIIKDLLPLYAEDMVSEDTRALVQMHIVDCVCCKEKLSAMRSIAKIPVDTDPGPLNQVKKMIRSRKCWSVAAAVLLVITILAGILMFVSVPVWLNAEEAIAYVEKLDDGQMKFKTTDLTYGYYGVELDTGASGKHSGFIYSMQRIRVLFPVQIPEQMNDASKEGYFVLGHITKDGKIERYAYDVNYYYLDYRDGSVESVLWDAGYAVPEGNIMTKNSFQSPVWTLQWLCIGSAVLFVLNCVVWVLLRKRSAGKWFGLSAAFFGAYGFSSLLVTSARFMTLESTELNMKLVCILTMTLLILLTILCAYKASTKKM